MNEGESTIGGRGCRCSKWFHGLTAPWLITLRITQFKNDANSKEEMSSKKKKCVCGGVELGKVLIPSCKVGYLCSTCISRSSIPGQEAREFFSFGLESANMASQSVLLFCLLPHLPLPQ